VSSAPEPVPGHARDHPSVGADLCWSARFAGRTASAGGEVTALLSLAGATDTITFSGGFPAPEAFPVDLVGPIVADLLAHDPARTLQYAPTEGLATTRAAIADLVEATQSERPDPAGVLVTSGGIDALSLLTRVFLDPGDAVVVEAPTYLGALVGFAESGAELLGIPMDADGMRVDELERQLAARRLRHVPKLCYVIPDYQNPTGLSLTLARRRALVELCRRHGVLVVEDVAYRELGFGSAPPPSLWSLGPDVVLQIGTFSKILFPGARLGWAVGPREVVAAMAVAKQNADQCAGALGQQVMCAFATAGHFPTHLDRARALYESRARAMLEALDRHMPSGARWTQPRGGFFVWLTAPEGTDMARMAARSRQVKVAFVPGSPFYFDGRGTNQVRLAYSSVPVERIDEGIARFAGLLAEELQATRNDAPAAGRAPAAGQARVSTGG
jgi:2-aminoadipate transaminase